MLEFTNQLSQNRKESFIDFFKQGAKSHLLPSISETLAKYDYDEVKYVQSLDLHKLRKQIFATLQASLEVIDNVQNFKQKQSEKTNSNLNEEKDPELGNSLQSLQQQIQEVPYHKDGVGSIEFDFGLLHDVQSSMHYLTWFNDKFNGFVEHLT